MFIRSLPLLQRLRADRLARTEAITVGAAIWIAGAFYCSGYEALLTGLRNWPGSLWWSAAAVLPWFVLFEWSKGRSGKKLLRTWFHIVAVLIAAAAASLSLEAGVNALIGSPTSSIALSLLRRLPAASVGLLLILWSRAGASTEADDLCDENLQALAPTIDWVGAADNYVELHMGGRTTIRRMTMRQAEQILVPRGFIRIHRRFLINRARIAGNGSTQRTIRLANGGELPVGRSFAANLNSRI